MGWGFDDDVLDERTAQEAEGARRQAARLSDLVRAALASPSSFQLTSELICELHETAMRGFLNTVGQFRRHDGTEIPWSGHDLPSHDKVADLVADACNFVNEQTDADPLFVAAYVMWRINWIHPFEDGNGRTARAASYLLLSVRLRLELQGSPTIPQRIRAAPLIYTKALRAADAAWAKGILDVSKMQELLAFYLAALLRGDPLTLPPGA